jgi:hypothetical protein
MRGAESLSRDLVLVRLRDLLPGQNVVEDTLLAFNGTTVVCSRGWGLPILRNVIFVGLCSLSRSKISTRWRIRWIRIPGKKKNRKYMSAKLTGKMSRRIALVVRCIIGRSVGLRWVSMGVDGLRWVSLTFVGMHWRDEH